MIEGGILADGRLHAAHPGRELCIFDVQFDIGGELAGMAVRAQVVGARYFRLAYDGQNRLGAQFAVLSLVSASTRDGPLLGGRDGELQQFGQRGGARIVHSRTHRHLDGFQIQTPGFAVAMKDDLQQLFYFARDFLLDRFRRFFS